MRWVSKEDMESVREMESLGHNEENMYCLEKPTTGTLDFDPWGGSKRDAVVGRSLLDDGPRENTKPSCVGKHDYPAQTYRMCGQFSGSQMRRQRGQRRVDDRTVLQIATTLAEWLHSMEYILYRIFLPTKGSNRAALIVFLCPSAYVAPNMRGNWPLAPSKSIPCRADMATL